jgi:hypothetical protein
MTWQNELQRGLNSRFLLIRALQGAGIALVLLMIFLLLPKNIVYGSWVLWPMLTVAIGGACGGIFYHLTGFLRSQGGWIKVAVIILCVLVYIVGLWLSLVYGLSVVGLWD